MVWYNQRWYNDAAQTVEQSRGNGWQESIHDGDYAATRAAQRQAMDRGTPLEQRVRCADGTYRWFLFQAPHLRRRRERSIRWVGSATDVHENRLIVDALRESDERFRLASQAAHMGF